MAVELATAYVTLVPSAVGIGAGIKSALAGAEVSNVAAQAGKTASGSFFSGFKSVAGLAAAAGIGVALKDAITGAGRFQSETELLVTAGGEAQSALGKVRSGIESIAIATGTSTEQLSSGMYTLEKAGLRGANGLSVLKVAAEGARAENVDLGTMTNALTSIMRSYNLPASQATQVTNELVAASGAAKTTMSEFAGSLSTVLPVASAAGLSFAQVGGAIATLTSHGTSAQEATQELANTIRSLQAPSHVASQEMAQFGLNSNTVSTQLGKLGLTGTLAELTNAITSKMGPAGLVLRTAFNQSAGAAADMKTEIANMPPAMQKLAEQFANGQLTMNQWRKEGRKLPADQRLMVQGFMSTYTQAHKFNDLLTSGAPGAQTYAQALEQMLGGATGLNTALQLTGGSSGTFLRNVDTIAAAGQKGGANISTWGKTQKNFNVQMGRLGEVAQTASINLGSALLPKLTSLGSFLANHGSAVLAFGAAFGALASAMLVGAVALKGYTAVEGVYKVLTGEAAAKTGLQTVALVAQKLIMGAVTLATKAWAAAQWLLNAALEGNPIVLIVTALIALGAAIYLAYTHSKTFRNAIEDVWKAVQVAASVIGGAFVTAWHTIVGAFDAVKGYLITWGPLVLAIVAPFIGLPLLIIQHWHAIVDFFSALPGEIVGFLSSLPARLLSVGSDILGGLLSGLRIGWHLAWAWFVTIPAMVLGEFVYAGVWLFDAGKQVLQGFINGIESMAGKVLSTISKAVTDPIGTAKHLLGIASPSTVFTEIGHNVMAGLVLGINNTRNDPAGAVGGRVAQMVAASVVGPAYSPPPGPGGTAPVDGRPPTTINVTAYNPAEAARKTAAEIGWLHLTRGQ